MVGVEGSDGETPGNQEDKTDEEMLVDNAEEKEEGKKVQDLLPKDAMMYKTQEFDENLGFDSIKDMLKRPSETVTEEVSRQLVIEDV